MKLFQFFLKSSKEFDLRNSDAVITFFESEKSKYVFVAKHYIKIENRFVFVTCIHFKENLNDN